MLREFLVWLICICLDSSEVKVETFQINFEHAYSFFPGGFPLPGAGPIGVFISYTSGVTPFYSMSVPGLTGHFRSYQRAARCVHTRKVTVSPKELAGDRLRFCEVLSSSG